MRVEVRQPRGFTLIEVLIVVAVIGVMALAAAPAVNSFTGANARAAASEIAGAFRYLFDTAALRHQTCRLVLDLDGREWWAECTTASPGARRNQPVMGKDGVAEDDERELARGFSDEKLKGSATFEKVWTPRNRDPQSKGKVYVYFYPQGQADRAQIPVSDGSNAYTVVTQPLTGRARVVTGIPEVPR
jgi:general secretion pathway protein H